MKKQCTTCKFYNVKDCGYAKMISVSGLFSVIKLLDKSFRVYPNPEMIHNCPDYQKGGKNER